MARIRTIKPEFPQSESMGRVSREARLLFILLWPICDDFGRTRAASRMLASLLFPYDDDAKDLIDGWLAELVRERCITLYKAGASTYLQVENWQSHQKIDHPSKAGKYPTPEEGSPVVASPRENSARTKDQGPRTRDSLRADEPPSLSNPPFALTPEETPKAPDPAKPPKSPLDVKADFWAAGKAYLAKHVRGDPGALIGKWCRDHGNGAVIDALAKAAAEAPAHPVSLIESLLRGSHGKRTDKPSQHAPMRAAYVEASSGRPAEPGFLDPYAPVGPGPQGGPGDGSTVVDLAATDFGPVDHGAARDPRARVLGGAGPDDLGGEVQGLSGGPARVPARLAG